MCGIAGLVDFNSGTPDPQVLAMMTRALRRRGPDAAGTEIHGPCGLAHTRLSIIDVEGSPQPMRADDHQMVIVYNGETYNYARLRAELHAQGEPLKTRGDTEVVLRSVARDWDQGIDRLNGMFAFAVWDIRRERLLLARDAFGEKPLYYAMPAPGLIVFGSEPKALLEHPAVSTRLNEGALRQALRFRAVYGGETLFEGIRQLEPGCWLEFSRGAVRTGRHYDLAKAIDSSRAETSGLGDAATVQRGRDLLMSAIESRLVADVPVGAFLSGGLDSSLIVAAMRKLDPSAEIRTFSVGFEDDPHNELPFAASVAHHVGTAHQPLAVGPRSYVERLLELSVCRDGPVSQPADVAIAEMSHQARQHVKVVLSGEGADEIFGGYPKYAFANAPLPLRAAARLAPLEPATWIAGMAGLDRRRVRVALNALSGAREIDRLVQWFSYLNQAELVRLLPGLDWRDATWEATIAAQSGALRRFEDERSKVTRMQAVDCLTWLPSNMLERGDRMTMAEGLEVRPPFLDKTLAAFGLGLSDRFKIRDRAGKWIVRQWAAELIPSDVIKRPKWGFRTPLANWFRGPLRERLHDTLLASDGIAGRYGDIRQIAALIREHDEGRVDRSEALWTLLSVSTWYQGVYKSRQADRALSLAS